MATSDILAHWNNAVLNIGAKTTIASLTEQSAEAAACAVKYQRVVEEILRDYDWNCVRRRAALTEASSGAVWPPAWTYMFLYPTDCHRVRGFDIGAQQSRSSRWMQCDYEVADDATAGRVIYMNEAEPVIIYTAYTYNIASGSYEAKFDAKLKDAIDWGLAAAIAGPLTGNASVVSNARQEAARALDEAKAANANESAPNNMETVDSESLQVRGFAEWPYDYTRVNW